MVIKMKINEEKCNAWCDMLMALMRMTKELNNDEAKYIKAMFSIAFGNLELHFSSFIFIFITIPFYFFKLQVLNLVFQNFLNFQ